MRLTPRWIAATLGAPALPAAIADVPISGATSDSRDVRGGELFIALPGELRDGHDFVADALQRGAAVALVNHVPAELDQEARRRTIVVSSTLKSLQILARVWRARFAIPIIGITGSVGKTTTKEVIADILASRYTVLRSVRSFNNEIGLPLTLLSLDSTHEVAVLEMGMAGIGEIAQLCAIARPSHGVVTLVGESHLEFLGTRDNIALAKQELVEALPPEGLAVLNADDPLVAAMAGQTSARVRTFGVVTDTAHLHLSDVTSRGLDGLDFTVHWRDRSYPMSSGLIGRHFAVSLAAGIIVGLDLGMQLGEIAGAVRRLQVDIRQRVVHGREARTILDDTYNAAPTSVLAALDLLAGIEGRRVAVLGDMFELGPDEVPGHERVGARAASAADVIITVGHRSRATAAAARRAGAATVVEFDGVEAALPGIEDHLMAGDTVLVKGSRAMVMERIVEALR